MELPVRLIAKNFGDYVEGTCGISNTAKPYLHLWMTVPPPISPFNQSLGGGGADGGMVAHDLVNGCQAPA